jgi:spore coat polysaccharide biosynthesis protein SpsF
VVLVLYGKYQDQKIKLKKKVVLIVQARMGSVRLPGKSLMDLVGQPLVGRILERVTRCKRIDAVVLAVPDTKQNDALASLAIEYGVDLYRGSENDLVDRYYKAARISNADIVGRLPADNPVPEPTEIDRIVDFHLESNYTFTSNLSEVFGNGYPDGIGAEMIDFSALEVVWKDCHKSDHREHVHLSFFDYIAQKQVDERFSVGTVQCPKKFSRPELVLDVNTIEQYDFIRELYEYLYPINPDFHITDIIRWYDEVYSKNPTKLKETIT